MMSKLNKARWETYKIEDVFDVFTGATIPFRELIDGEIPRITASEVNNGVSYFTKVLNHRNFRTYSNFLSVSFLGEVFYHKNTVSLDMKIHGIKPKKVDLNKHIALFLIPLIKNMSRKFSYGYQLSTSILKKQKLLLPITNSDNPEPDWSFMEQCMEEIEENIKPNINFKEHGITDNRELDELKWDKFRIGSLFDLKMGKCKGLTHLKIGGQTPYVGATHRNNGVLEFVHKEPKLISKGNGIVFIRNGEGSMGYSVYKSEDFMATSDISVGYNRCLNKYTGTFITTISDKVRGKYNFGYKRSSARLRNEFIMLPAKNGNPDWSFMEQYMKRIENDIKQNLLG